MTRRRHLDDFTYISPCVKYCLFFFNFIFWLMGLFMIAVGMWSFLEEYQSQGLPQVHNAYGIIFNISIIMIILGCVVWMISFAGCLGALRENLCLLKLYTWTLILLFLGEVALAIVSFVFPNRVADLFKQVLSKELITKYRDDPNLQNIIDGFQQEFHCCGISDKGYQDWSQNIYFNCTPTNPAPSRCNVPFSCCKNPMSIESGLINYMCGANMQSDVRGNVDDKIFTRGCVESIQEYVNQNMYIVAAVCLIPALLQLLAMFLSRTLESQISMQKSRWS